MNPVIKTRCGEVGGSVAHGGNTLKGIRYAAPIGSDPPLPVPPWSGVLGALTYGPKPPQLPYPPPIDVLLPELAVTGEDCLNLNIWSPEPESARQPVMVWIPGGEFEHGTGAWPWYDGQRVRPRWHRLRDD